ncbi:hypothetical protein R3P38DRAFT_3200273 [Favolaschia claudopus]|uniref:Uncharacterized protein n=1 Tax=Favolaschia claudopus TaxID=2862362 RepID=A0AAW0AZU2_9AGAR
MSKQVVTRSSRCRASVPRQQSACLFHISARDEDEGVYLVWREAQPLYPYASLQGGFKKPYGPFLVSMNPKFRRFKYWCFIVLLYLVVFSGNEITLPYASHRHSRSQLALHREILSASSSHRAHAPALCRASAPASLCAHAPASNALRRLHYYIALMRPHSMRFSACILIPCLGTCIFTHVNSALCAHESTPSCAGILGRMRRRLLDFPGIAPKDPRIAPGSPEGLSPDSI